jgi:hypothetical protein
MRLLSIFSIMIAVSVIPSVTFRAFHDEKLAHRGLQLDKYCGDVKIITPRRRIQFLPSKHDLGHQKQIQLLSEERLPSQVLSRDVESQGRWMHLSVLQVRMY